MPAPHTFYMQNCEKNSEIRTLPWISHFTQSNYAHFLIVSSDAILILGILILCKFIFECEKNNLSSFIFLFARNSIVSVGKFIIPFSIMCYNHEHRIRWKKNEMERFKFRFFPPHECVWMGIMEQNHFIIIVWIIVSKICFPPFVSSPLRAQVILFSCKYSNSKFHFFFSCSFITAMNVVFPLNVVHHFGSHFIFFIFPL